MSHPPLKPPEEEPAPPVLVPPDNSSPNNVPAQDHRPLFIFIGLIILLLLAGAVIWLLPAHNSTPEIVDIKPSVNGPTIPPVTSSSPTEKQQSNDIEKEMEQALEKWLRIKVRVEAENMIAWGGEDYQAAITLGLEGDRLRREFLLPEARNAFRAGTTALEQLLANKENLLTSSLKQGHKDLEQQNVQAAAQNFKLALAIAPNNNEALHGAKRADSLEQVISLYEEGQIMTDKNLDAARNLLQQAVSLDPEFVPAKNLLAKVKSKINQREFRHAITQGLYGLELKDFKKAEQALNTATALRPADPAVANLQSRLEQTRLAHNLESLRQKAEEHEAAEQWAACLQSYQKALTLAPQAGFAIRGHRKAKERLALDLQLIEIISNPQRIEEQGPLEEAQLILNLARTFANPGPRLATQISKIETLLKKAIIPVDVILQSDKLTDVVIYRVGAFGKFARKQIILRPGTYTVIGSRPGFRDVRLSISVTPEQNPIFIIVRCEEPI
ncbi:MAG: hypothetical protein OEM02_12385 [Desulfobulbaceae bacterium]|nr:hypothetical protein [Desulfobulbaceae bacterium]